MTAYRRELDLATAVARTTFSAGQVAFTRPEAFVSHPDRVLVIRLTASKPGALAFALRFESQLRHETSVAANGDLVLSGRAPVHAEPNYRRDIKDPIVYDEGPDAQGHAVRGAGPGAPHGRPRRARRLVDLGQRRARGADRGRGGHQLRGVRQGAGPRPRSRPGDGGAAGCARGTPYTALRAAHVRDFRALFDRVALDLGRAPKDDRPTDVRLRDYAGGRARSRARGALLPVRALPPHQRLAARLASRLNLQGIWNPHMRPPWSSNYTVNINTEMNYWPAETTNLAECHQPLLRFIGDLAKTGAVTARHFYGAGGWCVHHNSDIWAHEQPGRATSARAIRCGRTGRWRGPG